MDVIPMTEQPQYYARMQRYHADVILTDSDPAGVIELVLL